MKIVIVGSGIIGAALARTLARTGADVTVVGAGGGATPASFGWVNASFYLNEDHFRLRAEGIAAWQRLGGQVDWTGCLCWEEEGAAFDAQHAALDALGYSVDVVDAAQFAQLEPNIAPPARALRFMQEGIAEPSATAAALLEGVKCISGVHVEGIATRAGKVIGLATAQGHIAADRVVVAAGTGSPALLAPLGVALPMLERPGVMMRTKPVRRMFNHTLVAPGQELRQDRAGHIWAPVAAQHQSDDTTSIETPLDSLADAAIARLRDLLPGADLEWDRVMLAERPVPLDGLPVIGPCGPDGLFVAVMHSGITLAAITAELLGAEVLDHPLSNAQAALAAPYTPGRFQSG